MNLLIDFLIIFMTFAFCLITFCITEYYLLKKVKNKNKSEEFEK